MAASYVGAALLSLATQCGGPGVPAELIQRIVMHESGGNPAATNLNRNGTTDFGLAQINSSNLAWLGLTPATVMDPCRNIGAAATILRSLSVYATGSLAKGFVLSPPGKSVSYVEDMWNARRPEDRAVAAPPRLHNQFVVLSSK